MIWFVEMMIAVQAETDQDAQRRVAEVLGCGVGILTASVINVVPIVQEEGNVPPQLSGAMTS